MIGEIISHYRIVERLGEGGMGVVYLAEDITLGRRVAMKFLTSTAPDYRARFLREARAVSVLTHPNIATVFDYGETPEAQPYIVMELITGETLSDKLRAGSLPLAEATRIVSCIAEGLGEAHHQGVVHRDVKPSNVIITERGQVKVVDFGLVKQIYTETNGTGDNQVTRPGTGTRSDMIVGTPLYLSPEQATARPVDGRSDLFALGAVLYECLTGHAAFAGASVIEIGAQVIHVTPPVPSKFNPQVPPELDRITMKALEKKVETRYQSASEMIEDLQAVLPNLEVPGLPSRARPTKSFAPTPTHSASALTTLAQTFRQPRISWGTVIAAVLGLVLVVGAVVWWRRPAPYKPAPVALDWYNKGTDALREGAFLQASKALEQAVAGDPGFALAHARLAEAWAELDYADKAKDEMLRVQSLVPNRSQLVRTEALYLEAINATLTRDFPGAIRAYTDLKGLAPGEPQVDVDLGRAYEKNDDIKKAIESYVAATNRAPQYATAYLRVGVLYARQLDQASASAAFDRADTIYQALGNFEGQAEVSFQRGFLFDQVGKLDDARQHLQRALELAMTTANEYQQTKTLQKLGDVEVDANNLVLARKYMLDAIALAQAKGIDNLLKRGLVDLGNTFLAEANYEEAEKYVKQSLDLAQKQKDLRNAARANLVLGSLAERQGKSDQVISYVEQALPFYQQGGYRKELLQALALFGRAKVLKGEYDAAGQSFQQELKLSQQFGDQAQAGLAHDDYGLLLIKLARHPEAAEQFQESYGIAKLLGTKKNIVLSLINRANALWRLGRYDEANLALSEAAPMADQPDAPKNLSTNYYLAVSRMALSQQHFAEAVTRSEQAFALAGVQLKRTAIVATFTSGLARVLSGSSVGRVKCEQAVNRAREVGDPLLLAEALLALAEAQLRSGDAAAAAKTSLEAQELSARVGSPDNEFIGWTIAARASRGAGENQTAQEYAARAEKLLAGFQQLWGNDNYNSFLNRPDIQVLRTQLNDLLAQQP